MIEASKQLNADQPASNAGEKLESAPRSSGRIKKHLHSAWHSATLTSWANMFVQMIGTIIFIPMIISSWSQLDFGVFLLIASVNRFSLLFSDRLAVTSAMLISFLKSGATDLNPKYRDSSRTTTSDQPVTFDAANEKTIQLFRMTFGSLGTLLLGISIAVVSIVSILATISMSKLAAGEQPLEFSHQFAMGISLFTLFVRVYMARYEIFLRGIDQIATLGRWNALFNCVGLATNILFIQLGFSLVTWSIIFNGTLLLTCLRNYLLASGLKDHFDINLAPAFAWSQEVAMAIWTPMWRGLIGNLSYIGCEELVALAAPFFLNSDNATSFLLYNRLVAIVGPISQIPLTSRLPYMASLVASNNIEQLRTYAIKRFLFCGGLAVIGISMVGIVVPLFYLVSNRHLPTISMPAWSLISLLFTLERINSMTGIILEAGNVILYHWRRLMVGITTLLLVPLLFTWLGPIGGFLAVFLPRVILMHINMYSELCRFLAAPQSKLARSIVFPLLAIQLVLMTVLILASWIPTQNEA